MAYLFPDEKQTLNDMWFYKRILRITWIKYAINEGFFLNGKYKGAYNYYQKETTEFSRKTM